MNAEPNPLIDIARLVAAGIVGGLLATLSAHKLAICREKASAISQRKRAFLSFLKGWRYEIGLTRMTSGGFEGRNEVFRGVISTFIQEANSIEGDFPKPKRAQFRVLCSAIGGIEHPTIYGPDDRKKVQASIDSIIVFVEENSKS